MDSTIRIIRVMRPEKRCAFRRKSDGKLPGFYFSSQLTIRQFEFLVTQWEARSDWKPEPRGGVFFEPVFHAAWERRLFALHAKSGFPVSTFRPVFVHGPRQPFYREQFFWDRLLDRRPIILPDAGLAATQWVFVADVAEACVRAMTRPEAVGQAFNLGHVEPMTQRSFVEALARVAGCEPELVSVPRATITAAGGQLVGENLYFGEYLDLPPHTVNLDKARQLLGIVPTPLETAFQLGFEWYTAQPRRPSDYAFEDRLLGAL